MLAAEHLYLRYKTILRPGLRVKVEGWGIWKSPSNGGQPEGNSRRRMLWFHSPWEPAMSCWRAPTPAQPWYTVVLSKLVPLKLPQSHIRKPGTGFQASLLVSDKEQYQTPNQFSMTLSCFSKIQPLLKGRFLTIEMIQKGQCPDIEGISARKVPKRLSAVILSPLHVRITWWDLKMPHALAPPAWFTLCLWWAGPHISILKLPRWFQCAKVCHPLLE